MMWAIRFDFPGEAPVYAGIAGGGLGFAPRLETASLYGSREQAERTLANGYGDGTRPYGTVVEATDVQRRGVVA